MTEWCPSPDCSCRAAGVMEPVCYSGPYEGAIAALVGAFGEQRVRIEHGARFVAIVNVEGCVRPARVVLRDEARGFDAAGDPDYIPTMVKTINREWRA